MVKKTCCFVDLLKSYYLDPCFLEVLLDDLVSSLLACFVHDERRCDSFSA